MPEPPSHRTLEYQTVPRRPSPAHAHWPKIAGIVSLVLIAVQVFWCALITALSLLVITGDVQPVGKQGLFIAALMAVPLPLAAGLGVYALRRSSNRSVKVMGILGLIGAFSWLMFLAAESM